MMENAFTILGFVVAILVAIVAILFIVWLIVDRIMNRKQLQADAIEELAVRKLGNAMTEFAHEMAGRTPAGDALQVVGQRLANDGFLDAQRISSAIDRAK